MKIVSISEEKKMYTTKEDVAGIVERIKENENEMVEINLTENSFTPEALLEVLKAVSKVQTIEAIVFKGIFTQRVKAEVEQSLKYIVEYVSKLENVQYFDISDNALSLHGMDILAPMIEKMVHLRHLVMNNNGIGRDGGEYLGKCLANLAKTNSKLESVEAGRNRLEDSALSVAKSVALFPYMDTLKIYQNSVSAVVISDVLQCIKPLSMRVLEIGDNFLLYHGAVVLTECMNKWNLEVLDISDCLIGDKGFEYMAQNIQRRTKVQGELVGETMINMSYNEITSETIESMKMLIEKLSSSEIDISGNEYTKEEIEEIFALAERADVVIRYEDEEDALMFSSEEHKEAESDEELLSLEEKLADLTLNKTEEVQEAVSEGGEKGI